MSSVFENVVKPLHLFINGGEVVGISHLVKILTSFLIKTFNLCLGTPDKRKNITSCSNWCSCIEY